MGIVLFFKKRAEKAKEERQEFCKKRYWLFIQENTKSKTKEKLQSRTLSKRTNKSKN